MPRLRLLLECRVALLGFRLTQEWYCFLLQLFCIVSIKYTSLIKRKKLRSKIEAFFFHAKCLSQSLQTRNIFANYIKFQIDFRANLKILKICKLISIRDNRYAKFIFL